MSVRPMTSKDIQSLYRTLCDYHDVALIDHWNGGRETTMAVLTLTLNAMRVHHVPQFLQECTATLGNELYVPTQPGALPDSEHLFLDLLRCAEVFQRLVHFRQCDHPHECELLYYFAPTSRVYAELDAMRAVLEVYQWSRVAADADPLWEERDVDELLCGLHLYGCTDLSLELSEAKPRIEEMLVQVKLGAVQTETARDIIAHFGWDIATLG